MINIIIIDKPWTKLCIVLPDLVERIDGIVICFQHSSNLFFSSALSEFKQAYI